jgi:P4 family phage/plasmid primase-like protien
MELTSQYTDLNAFLAKHSIKAGGDTSLITHTRIGDKTTNIYGGSYAIPKEELPTFYQLYHSKVFDKKQMEYLTEKQQKEKGPILVDLDFRYAHTVTTRQHTKEQIQNIICLGYLEKLKEILVFEENTSFPIYVMEKANVNRLEDGSLTKDGIHIIIGIQMDHVLQQILRDKVLEEIPKILELPLINDWPGVLDETISKGTTNWQVFGSRKPGNKAYELTQYYKLKYDESDGEFIMEELRVADVEINKDLLLKISAQYDEHPNFQIQPNIKSEYEDRTNKKMVRPKMQTKTKLRLLTTETVEEEEEFSLQDIKNEETLKRAVENIFKNLKTDERRLKEIHDYTQVLPSQYYEPGSHDKNIKVAFALKNTDERLFLSWVMLRSKASDFDYASIPGLYDKWSRHLKGKPDGITKRSIPYWAKQDAPKEYERVKSSTIDHFIEKTLVTPTEWDFAMVLYQMFGDVFVCSSYVNKTWHAFKNHRWEYDEGQTLRYLISVDMYNIYQEKMASIMNEMNHYEANDERYVAKQKLVKWVSELSTRLRTTSIKNNIFREAHELFFDKEFTKNMDTNRYLMCFTNGVVDIKNKTFRDGYPQDYITKCTNIPYYKLDPEKDVKQMEEIQLFMHQLFPVEELYTYMWNHLSAVLIGENINQTFNIYRGSGSNGKSMLTELMSNTLGDYACTTVPITMVTEKRVGQGQSSSEIMQLKGIRYAVMQEPTKDTCRLNEGMMKNLTGDSSLQARELYCKSETFQIQFHLAVCTNNMFEINSNDDGTWRRICLVDYLSKFVDPGEQVHDDTPYQFPKDKNLKEKLPKMARVFASMLVDRVFESQGKVEICEMVRASSNKYRQGQDHIAAFVSEMIGKKEGMKVSKRELMEEFKIWFQDQQGGRRAPKGVELQEYMDKKFGKMHRDGWHNVVMVYPESDAIKEMA